MYPPPFMIFRVVSSDATTVNCKEEFSNFTAILWVYILPNVNELLAEEYFLKLTVYCFEFQY